MRAALRNGSCRACHAVGARNIARLRAQSRPAYCDAPKPSIVKAPEGKAPPKISGCRANGADITRTNAPQHQGSRSEEHTSELQSLIRISYAVFCMKKKQSYNITI